MTLFFSALWMDAANAKKPAKTRLSTPHVEAERVSDPKIPDRDPQIFLPAGPKLPVRGCRSRMIRRAAPANRGFRSAFSTAGARIRPPAGAAIPGEMAVFLH